MTTPNSLLSPKALKNSLLAFTVLAISSTTAIGSTAFDHKTIGQFIVQNNIDCKRTEDQGFACRSFRKRDKKRVKEESEALEVEVQKLAQEIEEAKISLDKKSATYKSDKKALDLKKKSLDKLKRYRSNLNKLSYAIKDAKNQPQISSNSDDENKNSESESNEGGASILQQFAPLGGLFSGQ